MRKSISVLVGILSFAAAGSYRGFSEARAGEDGAHTRRGIFQRTAETVAPDSKCGAAPRFLGATATFLGSDEAGGPVTFNAAFCLDLLNQAKGAARLFNVRIVLSLDLTPADTIVLTGEWIDHFNGAICVGKPNDGDVTLNAGGGSGRFAGARGRFQMRYLATYAACGAPADQELGHYTLRFDDDER